MLRLRPLFIAVSLCLSLAVSAQQKSAPAAKPAAADKTAPAANPFLKASTLQYQAPPFDKITDNDFQPAIEEGMKHQIGEIEKIANSADQPTFENTVEAMERTGATLTRAAKVF